MIRFNLRVGILVLVGMGLSVFLSTTIGLGLWFAYDKHRDAMARESFATEVVTTAFQLTSLTDNYLLYRGERTKSQWVSRHDALGELLHRPGFKVAGVEQVLARLRRDHSKVGRLFARIADSREESRIPAGGRTAASSREERLVGTLLTVAQSMVSQASLLSGTSRLALDASNQRIKRLTASFIVLLTGLLLCFWLVLTRRVIAPIQEIRKGIERFGQGDLDHRLRPRHADEIGEIATTFNEMASRLQVSLVSRDQLESVVAKRTRELAAANSQLRDELAARRLAEEAASAAETRSRDIVENSVEGIVQTTPEGRFISVNPAFARMLGYDSPEDLLNSITDIGTEVYADPQRRNGLRASVESGGDLTASESRYLRKDGSIVWLSENARAVRDQNGEILRYESFTQDITVRREAEAALRASEERFRKTFHASPIMICITEPDSGRYHDANDTYLETMGYDRDELVGKTVGELGVWVNSADRDRMMEKVGEQGFVQEFEMQARTKSGAILDCIMTSTSGVLEEKERLLIFIQDITDRKRAEQALHAAQDALLRKERLAALGQLTGTVAHELRNPLGAVATSAHVLRRLCAGQDAAVAKALDFADRGIRRCDAIITDLLDFARAKGLQPVPTNLDDWLSALLEEQHLPAGVTLRSLLNTNGRPVRFDPERLRRAVINVVDNACQAMSNENGADGRLCVETRVREGRVEIEIADDGPGIPEDSLARVLEPLYSTKPFGTGLGLPTVQRIMEEHGGGIEIDSKEGRGTRVVLWLGRDQGTMGGAE